MVLVANSTEFRFQGLASQLQLLPGTSFCQHVAILAAVEETRSRMLLGNPRYHLGSDGGSSMVDVSRNPTLLSWQGGGSSIPYACGKPTLPSWKRWGKLHGGCVQEPDVAILAPMEETRSRMLLQNPRYHLGSDGGGSMVDASTEATSGLACRSGMTAACLKNDCGVTGGSNTRGPSVHAM